MTRKDYILIAAAMKDALADTTLVGREIQHARDCHALAHALGFDNPRFDRDRFLKACGVAQ